MALGIGIVGCGNISSRYFDNAALFPGVEIRACADLFDAASKRCADRYGVRCSPVVDLLEADDIDLVINLTIPAAHYEISLAALEAGKHVYTEKPLAATAPLGRKLVEVAERIGLRLGSAPDTFLGAAGQTARSLVDGGKIGGIVGGACYVMSRGAESWHPNPDFLYREGGGPVLDLGPYYVTMLVNLMGPVRKVSAMAATPFATRTIGSGPRQGEKIAVETPTSIHCILEFASGALVSFSASWDVWHHGHNNIEIYGEAGSMVVPDPNFFGGEVKLTERDGPLVAVPDDGHPLARHNRQTRRGMVADYRAIGLADMAAAIAEGRPHRCDGKLGLHVLDVLEGILLSARESRAVSIGTSCIRPASLSIAEVDLLMGKSPVKAAGRTAAHRMGSAGE